MVAEATRWVQEPKELIKQSKFSKTFQWPTKKRSSARTMEPITIPKCNLWIEVHLCSSTGKWAIAKSQQPLSRELPLEAPKHTTTTQWCRVKTIRHHPEAPWISVKTTTASWIDRLKGSKKSTSVPRTVRRPSMKRNLPWPRKTKNSKSWRRKPKRRPRRGSSQRKSRRRRQPRGDRLLKPIRRPLTKNTMIRWGRWAENSKEKWVVMVLDPCQLETRNPKLRSHWLNKQRTPILMKPLLPKIAQRKLLLWVELLWTKVNLPWNLADSMMSPSSWRTNMLPPALLNSWPTMKERSTEKWAESSPSLHLPRWTDRKCKPLKSASPSIESNLSRSKFAWNLSKTERRMSSLPWEL